MRKVLTGAVIAAVGAVLGAGIVGASDGLPSQTPGMNFNQSVPPVVVTPREPVPAVPSAPAGSVATPRPRAVVRAAIAVPAAAPVTAATTIAPVPVCPTGGTVFAYGSCTLPAAVHAPTGSALGGLPQPGAPSKIVTGACGLELLPAAVAAPQGDWTCNPPTG